MSYPKEKVLDKDGKPISTGDHVYTAYRGGTRRGEVEAVFLNSTTEPAEQEEGHDVHVSVKNPPKVVFTNQRGKQVSHNPSTLTHAEKED